MFGETSLKGFECSSSGVQGDNAGGRGATKRFEDWDQKGARRKLVLKLK